MVQEFYILKCCTCNFFQVHIVKKAKTWVCKMCGLKQSIIKVYGQGSAKECRVNVQNLNEKYQSKQETVFEEITANAFNDLDEKFPQSSILEDNNIGDRSRGSFRTKFSNPLSTGVNKMKKSKWSAYLDEEPEQTQEIKKCKWDSDTGSVNGQNKVGSRNRDSMQSSGNGTERYLQKLTGIQYNSSTPSRLRTTEELLKSFNTSCDSNADSWSRIKNYGSENNEKYLAPGECKLKTENCIEQYSATNSLDSKTRVTKISTSLLTDQEDIDSILNL